LTKKAIDALAAPDPTGKLQIYWDDDTIGFGVSVSGVSSIKTFVAGTEDRVKIARVGDLSLKEAREKAIEIIKTGKITATVFTLRSALEDYLAKTTLRPASVKVYSQIKRTLEPWLDRPLAEITPDMVSDKHKKLAKEIGEFTANAAMRTLRILWNHAADRSQLPTNPTRLLKRKWFDEPRRQSVVSVDELPAFHAAVVALENKIASDFIRLLLYTGFRKGEASRLKWSDIDFTKRTINVPKTSTKNKRELVVPMSDLTRDLLIARRAVVGSSGYIFIGDGKAGYISDTQTPFAKIAKATGIDITAHDCRRTFVTVAESCNISLLELSALVNHSLGRSQTEKYVVLTPDRLREPVAKVAEKLATLCQINQIDAANVVKLA